MKKLIALIVLVIIAWSCEENEPQPMPNNDEVVKKREDDANASGGSGGVILVPL